MTNREKYDNELYEIWESGWQFSVKKENNTVRKCSTVMCDGCLFRGADNCISRRKEWLKQEYIEPKSEVASNALAQEVDGMKFVCVRTYSAGVHCGYLKEHKGKEVTLLNAIRVWSWAGACSLSELATLGSKKIDGCKYTVTVPEILLTEAIEIIPMSEAAKTQMEGAKRWQM